MMMMRNKVEYTIRRSALGLKNEVRKALRQFICQLPVRRVWLFVKYSRSFFGETLLAFFNTVSNGVPVSGPEDVVLDGESCQSFLEGGSNVRKSRQALLHRRIALSSASSCSIYG
jgi:hypothetical protein